MTTRRPIPSLVALALAASAFGCDRLRGESRPDIAEAPPAAATPAIDSTPTAAVDSPVVSLQALSAAQETEEVEPPAPAPTITPVERPASFPLDADALHDAVEAFAARNLYLHWTPEPTDRGTDRVCRGSGDDVRSATMAWALARAHVRRVWFTDSTGTRAAAELEVIRVATIETDPETSDGTDAAEDMMTVGPANDAIELELRRRRDGRWVTCHLAAKRRRQDQIALIGASADREAPRGRRLSRFVPEGASWLRAGALADSIERTGVDPDH